MKARILAYHRVCDEPAQGLETWAVRPAVFRRQMTMLRHMGYRGVSVRELLDALDSGDSADRLVGLTFDDGYLDTVETAFPILDEFGFSASVYVVPDAVGSATNWESTGATSPLAGWNELRELVYAGWEIGMHSRSHPARFDLLTGAELEREVREGIQRIEDQLATRVDTFAYPHGNYSGEVLATVAETGYRAALTTHPGEVTDSSNRFVLPRYEIKRRDKLVEFGFMMLTGVALRRRATFFQFGPASLREPVGEASPNLAPATYTVTEDRTKDAA